MGYYGMYDPIFTEKEKRIKETYTFKDWFHEKILNDRDYKEGKISFLSELIEKIMDKYHIFERERKLQNTDFIFHDKIIYTPKNQDENNKT